MLQVLGALLLAAACVVFLLFSWGWLGLVGRAAVIGIGTVVVFVAASGLRRARLGSSAEAVGGIGTVMLLLDAWAVHATGLISPSSGAVYAAVACLVCALLLGAWGHFARIRTGAAAAAVLLPVAPVLLAPLTPGHTSWLLVGSVLLASSRFAMDPLVTVGPVDTVDGQLPDGHTPLEEAPRPGVEHGAERVRGWSRIERGVLEWVAWLAAGSATVVALVDVLTPRATPWSPAAALLVLAVLAGLQSRWARGRRPGSAQAWESAAGALLALGAAGVALAGVHAGIPSGALWACGPVGAAAVTIGLSRSAGRATRGALVVTMLVSAPSAAMLMSLLAAMLVNVRLLPEPWTAAAMVVGALALYAATRLASPWRAVRVGGAWTAALAALVMPGPVLSTWPGLGSVGLVLLLAAVAALAHLADRAGVRLDVGARAPVRALVVLAPTVSLIASRDARSAGLALLACAAAAAVARRWAPGRAWTRAVLLATSIGLLWSGSVALLAERLALGTAAPALAVLLLAGVVAAVLAPRVPWTRADRGAALGVASAVSVIGWAWSALPAQPSALDRVTVAALPVAAALAALLVAGRGRSALGQQWQVAAAAAWGVLVPSSLLVVSMATDGALLGASLPVAATAVAGASVLLAGPLSSGHEGARRATEIAAWAMAGIQMMVAAAGVSAEGGAGRLALAVVVASVIAGAWSLRRDRRWARWWALGLGVAATWVLLLDGGVGVPEAYLAPTGVVLLVVALRRRRLGGEDDVPLLLSGLALALVPTALLGGDLPLGDVPRAALALGAGAALVAWGMWGRTSPALAAPRRDVVLWVAALVLVLGPTGRALVALEGERGLLGVEAWSLPAAALVVIALRGLASCSPPSRQVAVLAGPWTVAAVVAVPSLLAVDASVLGAARWSVLFAAGGVLAVRTAARGAWRTTGGVAAVPVGLAVAAIAALVGSSAASTTPWDVPLALLGLLLVAVAALLLDSDAPGAAQLSTGALLMLPTALHHDLWRMLTTLLVGAALVASAELLRRAPASRVVVLVGSALVLAGPVRHGLVGALDHSTPSIVTPSIVDVELWTITAALVLLAAARALHHLSGADSRAVARLAPWLLTLVLVLPTALAVDGTLAGVVRWTCVIVAGTAMAWWAAWSPHAGARAGQLVAVGLTACALATPSALQHGVLPSVELPLVVLGAVLTATGALWAARGHMGTAWTVACPLLLASLALGPAAPWRAPVVLATAAALIAASAAVLSRGRLSAERGARAAQASAGPLLGAALLSVAVTARYAAVPATARDGGATPGVGDVELWSLPSAALLTAVLVLAAWRWPYPSAGPRRWGLPLVTAVALAPTLLAVDSTGAGAARALAVLTAGSTLALVAGLRADVGAARGRAVATGLVSAAVAALLGAWLAPVVPPDVYLVLLGTVVLTLGTARLRRDPDASSWSTLGIGLVLVLAVPFATGWATPTTWRLLLVVVGALVAVVAGAVLRWQAPFLLGGAVLGAVALIQASPAAVAAMRVVEWWAVLAVGGAVLLGLGLTYERRLREAREAVRFVGAMR
ncbi:SCO7613 C-terminal domain-containing membrane protein [Cellulomonas timonensis]|uniref:SCO7613 C-terminal domain-containing membrane protein n=1 Tax=Cellulomonas timonensis TaxID=1689271 RepID=UPI00082BA187|nr:hypothetical protein [Cellulomonas timonensis]